MANPSLVLSGSILLIHHSRDGTPRVFWARRHPNSSFLSGYHCFPGGRAEPEDLEVPTQGGDADPEVRQAQVAAIRETWEEVGYLVGAQLSPSERVAFEQAISAGTSFANALKSLHITLDLTGLIPAGRWRTPDYVVKPFLTYFYAAEVEAPEYVKIGPDHSELQDGAWITAQEALAAWSVGEVLLAPSTQWLLEALGEGALNAPARFEAIEEARGQAPRYARIRPGVTLFPVLTPTLPPATHTNVYIGGERTLWVFDPASPYPEGRSALEAHLRARMAEGAEVKGMVLTHHHNDHVGGAAHLARALGVPIYGHPETASRVGFDVDVLIDEGDVLPCDTGDWQVLHTPGHAPGHLCFLDTATRCMVSGDMVAGVGTILVEPGDGSMALYLESLRRLRDIAPACLMPSHGPVIGGVEAKLTGYIEHRLMREALVMRALTPAPTPLAELLPQVYGDVAPEVWPIAELSLKAHLIKLEEDGRATSSGDAWASSIEKPSE
ncbi:MAG: MBL fold metallo-hydrolase [Bradymonadia bacterium]